MRLPRLPLQAMLLLPIRAMIMIALARMTLMLQNILLAPLDLLLIHIIQDTHAKLDVSQQLIASALAEILSDDDSQHLEVFGIGRHGVGGHDP